MAQNPKQIEEKINQVIDAWERLAPEKIFGGMTLEEAKKKTAPSLDTRSQAARLQTQLAATINQRDDADKGSLKALDLVVKGVVGDPSEGDDSALYEAMGYIRKSERQRGLTRKRKSVPEA